MFAIGRYCHNFCNTFKNKVNSIIMWTSTVVNPDCPTTSTKIVFWTITGVKTPKYVLPREQVNAIVCAKRVNGASNQLLANGQSYVTIVMLSAAWLFPNPQYLRCPRKPGDSGGGCKAPDSGPAQSRGEPPCQQAHSLISLMCPYTFISHSISLYLSYFLSKKMYFMGTNIHWKTFSEISNLQT